MGNGVWDRLPGPNVLNAANKSLGLQRDWRPARSTGGLLAELHESKGAQKVWAGCTGCSSSIEKRRINA